MSDKVILTTDEAIDLLAGGDQVHNYIQAGFSLVGCDYERANAIKEIREAKQIELAGPAAMAMKHPIAVWSSDTCVTFFEADMEKVAAFEKAKSA